MCSHNNASSNITSPIRTSLCAHGNTMWQQSCSHSPAICKHRLKKGKDLRTHEQPLIAIAEHKGGTDFAPVRPQPHPPHTRGTFHRRLQPLDPKKQGCVPRLSPKTTPVKIHAVTRMRLAAKSHTTFRRSLLLCDVKSHTDLHCSLLSCAVESETTFYCSLLLSGVKSYTALHCSLFLSDVKYRTTLHCSLLFSHRHSSQSIVI